MLERKKWTELKSNLQSGDLKLVADETFSRGKWLLGRVVEVIASRDGWVRAVKVKTSATVATCAKRQYRRQPVTAASTTTILTRPVTKLCFLEMDGVADRVGPV